MNDKEHRPEESREEASFADLLEQSMEAHSKLEPGQKVAATVLQISAECLFLDVGQKGEGILDIEELLDAERNLTVKEGDSLSVYFLSGSEDELRFTTRLGGAATGTAQLEEAWRGGIPVEGRIAKEIKGGYEIRLPGGVRAFCPYSQLGRRREEPEGVVETTRSFKITRFEERGRNLVVSHREILEEEQRRQREALQQSLEAGMIVSGTVTNIRDFGAFVDIGGIEGLLPVSEVGWGRVENIHDVLQVGQELEVAVKSLDWENHRFSFSLRETLADPWAKVGRVYREGMTVTGTVARLAPFGAFVTLEEGIDGLVHISRLGEGRRLHHPREVLQAGQALPVTIEKIDREARRLSLVPAKTAEAENQPTSYTEQSSGTLGTLGELLKAAGPKKKR